MVTIKRYPNRRLYDSQLSSYITLGDIAERVRRAEDFRVIDAKSGQDLTRRVLTQVVLEEARQGEAGPPVEFLRHLILASDPDKQSFLNWYLGQALEAYGRMQADWKTSAPEVPLAPRRASSDQTDTQAVETSEPKAGQSSSSPGNLLDEMNELRRRMAEMEQRLKQP